MLKKFNFNNYIIVGNCSNYENKRFRLFSTRASRKINLKNLTHKSFLIKKDFYRNFQFKFFNKMFGHKSYNSFLKKKNKIINNSIILTSSHFHENFIISKPQFSFYKLNYIIKKLKLFCSCGNFLFKYKFLNLIHLKQLVNFYSVASLSKNSEIYIKNRIFPFKKYFMPTKKILFQHTQKIISSFIYLRLINIFVHSGLKAKIELNTYKTLFQFKDIFSETDYKLVYTYNFILLSFISKLPKLTVKGVRRGSVVYKVPFLITPFQQFSIFLKWFKDSVCIRNENSYSNRLFKELLDILDENHQSETLKKRSSLNKAVINGRSFSHYRWV